VSGTVNSVIKKPSPHQFFKTGEGGQQPGEGMNFCSVKFCKLAAYIRKKIRVVVSANGRDIQNFF
jgi:hypothetical protein